MAFASVDDDLSFRIYALYCIIAFIGQDGEIGRIAADLSYRMQHAAVGLVADLHPLHIDSIVLEQLQSLFCVSLKSCCKLIYREICPCGRSLLVRRICPGVAVVEVDHDPHAEFLCALGLYKHVLLGAPASFWINPYTQAYRIESQLLHQSCTFHLLSI